MKNSTRQKPIIIVAFCALITLTGCGNVVDGVKEKVVESVAALRFGGNQLEMPADVIVANPAENAQRNAYFGDLHVHTAYSFDAFAFGTTATPYDAYRYATGQAIKHPAGFDVQLRQPLDFYAVTDHAMFLGAVRAAADTSTEFSKLEYVKDLHNLNAESNLNTQSVPQRIQAFRGFLPGTLFGISDGGIWLIRTVI